MNHPSGVDFWTTWNERVRVHDDAAPTVVPIHAKFQDGYASMRREQDKVGVVKLQPLGRFQRLALQEQRCQHAQRSLIGSAQPTRWGTALQRVSPERFGDRVPSDDAPYAPVSDFVEHGHMLDEVVESRASGSRCTFSSKKTRGKGVRRPNCP